MYDKLIVVAGSAVSALLGVFEYFLYIYFSMGFYGKLINTALTALMCRRQKREFTLRLKR